MLNTNTNINQVGSTPIVLGQSTMTNSLPVTISSNQSNLPTNLIQINGSTVLSGVGTASTGGGQRVVLSYESTEKYNIARQYQSVNTHTVRSILAPIATGTTYFKPTNWAATNVANLADGNTIPGQFFVASAATTDTNKIVVINGYNNTGAFLREELTLNATNSQTPVTTANSYLGISKFFYKIPSTVGVGNVFINYATFTGSAAPTLAVAQIDSGGTANSAKINWVSVPSGYNAWLTEIIISKPTGSASHTLILCRNSANSGGNTSVGSTSREEIFRWSIMNLANFQCKYDGFLIPNTSASGQNTVIWAEALASATDATALVSISMTFLFTQ